MPGKINIFTTEWCEMVFEGKNKEYGAYENRQKSSNRHALALILAVTLMGFGISAPLLIKALVPGRKLINTSITEIKNVKLDQPKEELPPEAPPPPPIKKTIQFVPPEITNEDVQEEIPPVDKLKQEPTAIGSTTNEGTDDANAVFAEEVKKPVEEVSEPLSFVEQMPEFPGGPEAMMKFLHDNIKYPPIAQEMGITGRVNLKFVVDKNGKIGKVEVVRSLGGGCDEEAIRVVRKMPDFSPGKQNGKAVPVWYNLPVTFTLQQQ